MRYKIVIGLFALSWLVGVTTPGPSTSLTTRTLRTAQDENLDLREANVVDVEYTKQSGNTYEFHVTLYHDDDGEEGYADWWQVETLDGELLGRRDLTHAHGTQPFTRSQTVTIPEGVTYVVVRGHDQTHGYGGQAMVVNLGTGEVEEIQQGSEPMDFSDYVTSKPEETSSTTVHEFNFVTAIAGVAVAVGILSSYSRRKS